MLLASPSVFYFSTLSSAKPYERAEARFWAKFIDEKCLQLLPTMAKASHSIRKEREHGIEEAQQQLKIMEDELKGKQIFAGRRIGFQAYALFPTMQIASLGKARRQGGSRHNLLFKYDFMVMVDCVGWFLVSLVHVAARFSAHLVLSIGTLQWYRYPNSTLESAYRYC
ncbi:hypothetical protein GQ457_01G034560 [Hibiscus cannabinus]